VSVGLYHKKEGIAIAIVFGKSFYRAPIYEMSRVPYVKLARFRSEKEQKKRG